MSSTISIGAKFSSSTSN